MSLATVKALDDPSGFLSKKASHQAQPLPVVPEGGSALMSAAQAKDSSALTSLIKGWPKTAKKKVSDVFAPLSFMTPLMYACYGGAEPKDDNKDNDDEDLYEVQKQMIECCNVLIKAGVDVNAQDRDGNTAMHFATQSGHDPVVVFLLNKGGSTLIRNTDGNTPYDVSKLFTAHKCAAVLSAHDGVVDRHWNTDGVDELTVEADGVYTDNKVQGQRVLSPGAGGGKTYGLKC
jgi:hypothetical protein